MQGGVYLVFKINGICIKNPSTFKIERFKVTTLERLASGEMTGDLVAKKLKFYFTYDAISAKDLDNILKAIWDNDDVFYTLKYDYNGSSKTCTVYVGSIPTSLYRAGRGDNWVWHNVSFNLIER